VLLGLLGSVFSWSYAVGSPVVAVLLRRATRGRLGLTVASTDATGL